MCTLGSRGVFQRAVRETDYSDRRLDWLLVERLYGIERDDLWALVYKERASEKESQIAEKYKRYHELILAGKAGDYDTAQKIAEKQAAWFKKSCGGRSELAPGVGRHRPAQIAEPLVVPSILPG